MQSKLWSFFVHWSAEFPQPKDISFHQLKTLANSINAFKAFWNFENSHEVFLIIDFFIRHLFWSTNIWSLSWLYLIEFHEAISCTEHISQHWKLTLVYQWKCLKLSVKKSHFSKISIRHFCHFLVVFQNCHLVTLSDL